MRFASKTSVALCLLVACLSARADIFLRGELRITSLEDDGRYEIVAEVPRAVTDAGTLSLPAQCRSERHQSYLREGTRVHAWDVGCDGYLGSGDEIGLPFRLDALSVTVNDGRRTETSVVTDTDRIPLARPVYAERPVATVAGQYLWQGMIHIWMGWDHLAFVLCLCFIARSRRQLLALITAFTVGHSVSMALSFLQVISIAIPPVEAIIALSIAWMARDALVGDTGDRMNLRHFVVVTVFGLVHGLGFASALDELGVAAAERVAALAFFNLGVEAGQLLFVAAVIMLLRLLNDTRLAVPVTRTALFAVGSIGGFWMIERIAGFAVA